MAEVLELMKGLLPKKTQQKIDGALKFLELFDEIVPEEKQEALFKAVSEAIPAYKLQKKIHFNGEIYPIALFIGDPIPEDFKDQKKKGKKP